MTNHNAESRFDGTDRTTAHGRMLPYQSGVLSSDFKDRLESLKEASGLTWSAFSQTIGVDRKQVRRWRRKGVEPSGGAMESLYRFAGRFPGGLDILMGDGFQMNLWETDDQAETEDDEDQEDQEEEER